MFHLAMIRQDHAFILFPLLCLPILWLPLADFIYLIIAYSTLLLWAILARYKLLAWTLFLVLLSYARVAHFANELKNQTALAQTRTVKIVQLQKLTDYQAAIGQLENGERIYLNWQSQTPLKLEQHYQIQTTFRPISARLNEGNFDRQRWYAANHIQATATIKQAIWLENQETSSWRTKWLYRVVDQTDTFPTQGLLLALAFGERAWLNHEHWQIFQQTGTAHLIAISGLHIALAMAVGFWLAKLGQWGMLYAHHRYAIRAFHKIGQSYLFPRAIGLSFALGYSYLAGFSIPTLRAIGAILLILVCQFARRHYTLTQLWWRIVSLLLLLDPLTLLSDSFWLSISAVASLIIWYRYFPLSNWIATQNFSRVIRGILSLFHLQLGILLIFAPVQFFFFQGSSTWNFLANILIVPLYSFVLVPIILLTLMTDNLFSTWQWADWLAQSSLTLISPLSESWISLSYQTQWELLSLDLAILMGLYAWKNKRKVYWLSLGIIVPLFYGLGYMAFMRASLPSWITFDVGQGLAQALIYETSGQKKAIFYDTGISWGEGASSNNMAKLEILPYLQREGITVEAIFLSHDDNDHAGGVETLLQHYPHARLISSSQKRYAGYQPESCVAGKSWQFGHFQLQAIYPAQTVLMAKNQDSCVLLVSIRHFRWLLTGDSGAIQEREWSENVGQVDFLQVPHHGSKTSSSEALLQQTKPRVAIISSGRWNPWKMPNKQVIERLNLHGVQTLNTAEVGMVKIEFAQAQAKLTTARHKNSPWYQGYFEFSN